jgi:hypothetical protein
MAKHLQYKHEGLPGSIPSTAKQNTLRYMFLHGTDFLNFCVITTNINITITNTLIVYYHFFNTVPENICNILGKIHMPGWLPQELKINRLRKLRNKFINIINFQIPQDNFLHTNNCLKQWKTGLLPIAKTHL